MISDFEFDGVKLSKKGFIIGKISDSGTETVEVGVPLTFTKVPTRYGRNNIIVNSKQDDTLKCTIQIFRDPCRFINSLDISLAKVEELTEWLNRREYKKLKFIGDKEYQDIYFMAQINVSMLRLDGKVYGLELTIDTLHPYAIGEEKEIILEAKTDGATVSYKNLSQDEGILYPNYVKIVCVKDGDLIIKSVSENNRETVIRNCNANEVISMWYPMITSSVADKQIQNYFNWKFIRLIKSYGKTDYEFNFNLPCTMTIRYNPIIKMGM